MNTIKTLMDALKTGRPFTDEERKETYNLLKHINESNTIEISTKDGAGYSIFVKANVSSEDEALQYAIDSHLFEEDGDEKYVDYVKEIDEEDYHDATGK